MVLTRHVATGLGCLSLAACPQLLEDEFENVPFGAVPHNHLDAGELHLGGGGGIHAGGGSAGSDASTSGAAGNMGGTGSIGSAVRVLTTSPEDGDRGVSPDVELVFTFSAPMNTNSVQAAYFSSELPAAQVSFEWSADDTVLRMVPKSPLRVQTGSDLSTVWPASYTIDLRGEAKDKNGHPLAPAHVNFTVLREITKELATIKNRDLTGNWQTDTYGSIECERADTTICVGDGVNTYKGFLSFNLDELPDDVVSISAAALNVSVQSVYGAPFSALGALRVEPVDYGMIDSAAFSAPALSASKPLSFGSSPGQTMSADVLAEVSSDWSSRNRSQFRLFFNSTTNDDEIADQVVCDWRSVHLALSYLIP